MEPVVFDVSSVSWWDGSSIYIALTFIGALAIIAWIVSAINREAGIVSFIAAAIVSGALIILGVVVQTAELDLNRERGIKEDVRQAGYSNVQVSGVTVTAKDPEGKYAEGVIYWESRTSGEIIWR